MKKYCMIILLAVTTVVNAQYAEIANPVYELNSSSDEDHPWEPRQNSQSSGDYFNGMSQKVLYDRMIIPYGLEVTFDKTVHIIFPSAIRYVDLGSTDIIAGKADGVENVLRIKAAIRDFDPETNFTVITEEGSFYSFNVKYVDEPAKLNIEMKNYLNTAQAPQQSQSNIPIYMDELGSESPRLMNVIMQSIYSNNKKHIRHIGSKRFGVEFSMKGLYTYNGLLFFHTEIRNRSNIPFDIDYITFRVVGRKMAKRTAMQEEIIEPLKTLNFCMKITNQNTERTIFVLPKFTLDYDKKLIVELHEKNGGRYQSFEVENSDLLRARLIDELRVY